MLDTLREAPARIARGWARTVARVEGTEGQKAQEAETRTSLGLMAQARAAAEMTPEQQIFLSQSEHGMRERLSVLLGIPHRTLAQEREKVAIEAWLTRDAPAPAPSGIRGFLGPMAAANPLAGVLMSPALWVVAAFAIPSAVGFITATKLRWERDRSCSVAELRAGAATTRRPCIDLGDTQRQLEHSRASLAEATRMVSDADRNAAQTAETLRRLERQRQVRAAQQRRTQRELETLRNGLGEPPELGLRDAEPDTPAGQNGVR